jgi:hypothetical protein
VAAGVKTAAIVNYEKYVTHPAPPVAGEEGSEAEGEARTKSSSKAAGESSSG